MYRPDTWNHPALRKRPGINSLWCKATLHVFAGAGNSFPVRFLSLQFFSHLFEKDKEVYEIYYACQRHTAYCIRHTASDEQAYFAHFIIPNIHGLILSKKELKARTKQEKEDIVNGHRFPA